MLKLHVICVCVCVEIAPACLSNQTKKGAVSIAVMEIYCTMPMKNIDFDILTHMKDAENHE